MVGEPDATRNAIDNGTRASMRRPSEAYRRHAERVAQKTRWKSRAECQIGQHQRLRGPQAREKDRREGGRSSEGRTDPYCPGSVIADYVQNIKSKVIEYQPMKSGGRRRVTDRQDRKRYAQEVSV